MNLNSIMLSQTQEAVYYLFILHSRKGKAVGPAKSVGTKGSGWGEDLLAKRQEILRVIKIIL